MVIHQNRSLFGWCVHFGLVFGTCFPFCFFEIISYLPYGFFSSKATSFRSTLIYWGRNKFMQRLPTLDSPTSQLTNHPTNQLNKPSNHRQTHNPNHNPTTQPNETKPTRQAHQLHTFDPHAHRKRVSSASCSGQSVCVWSINRALWRFTPKKRGMAQLVLVKSVFLYFPMDAKSGRAMVCTSSVTGTAAHVLLWVNLVNCHDSWFDSPGMNSINKGVMESHKQWISKSNDGWIRHHSGYRWTINQTFSLACFESFFL